MITLSLWVIAGSALGGLARFWIATVMADWAGTAFPWGTLLINVVGSLLIGFVGAATDARADAAMRAFIMVGVCGGFTTFSSFSLQTLELLQIGRTTEAMGYILSSVMLCVVAVWAGWMMGRAV